MTRSRARLALLVLATCLPVVVIERPPAARATPPGLAFSVSGMDGAGFMNVADERDGVLLGGGDVSGLHRSTDAGGLWSPQNGGLEAGFARFLGIADIAFSETVPGEVYVCFTQKGFYASTDSGQTWTLRSALLPVCGGGNNPSNPALPKTHPRSTGDLIVQAGGNLYVGSFDGGVFRSSDDGYTWTPIALTPEVLPDTTTKRYYIRGVAGDPDDPGTLYVGTYGDGVWKVTGASTATPTAAALTGSPSVAEETIVVDDTIYVAAGSLGIFKSANDGATWTAINNGAVNVGTTADWQSIAGYVNGGGDVVLYAGANEPVGSGSSYNSVIKSINGGASWSSITLDPSKVHGTIGGPGGPLWWFYTARPLYAIGRKSYVAAQIVIDSTDPETVYVAGRSGLWKSTDGGVNWYPIVRGLGVTINRAVVVDPNNPARVYIGNTDWVVLRSTDAMATVTNDMPPLPGNTALGMAVDSRIFVAYSARDENIDGRVISKPVDGSGSWFDEDLQSVAGGKRALGVAVGVDASGQRVLLAAVDEGGVVRKVGAGAWATVSTTSGPMTGEQATKQASFSWTAGSPNVYLYDRASGVWRSQDFGVTWTRIWNLPSDDDHTGYVAADPLDGDVLYVSSAAGLYRLTGASTGVSVEDASITDTPIPGVARPGAIALLARGDSTLAYVVSRSGEAPYAAPGLFASSDGTTWSDVSDALYKRVGLIPHQIAVGPDGRVYLSLDGNGVIVGTPPVLLSMASTTDPVTDANEQSTGASGTATPGATVSVVASDGTTTTAPAAGAANGAGAWSITGLDVSALDDGPIRYTATATVGTASVTAARDATKTTATAQPNDAFAGAQALTGTVGSLARSTVGATKEAGEPNHAGNTGGRSIWFTWKPGATGNVTFDTSGSDFDTLLAVYTGSPVSALTPVAANDNRSASDQTSEVTFKATAGVTYRIAVDGRNGASGNALLNRAIDVTNSGYKPAISIASPMGSTVLWQFVGPSQQRVLSSIGLFDSGVRGPGETFTWAATTAGQFTYRSVSASMTGRVSVPPMVAPSAGTRTTPFLVTWALGLPAGAHFDVQVKRPGAAWQNWQTNVTTTSATYTPGASAPAGGYFFQARLRLPGGVSGWSPQVKVTVS